MSMRGVHVSNSDKEKAFELRKSGVSYREISKTLSISKTTLSSWFSKQEWSGDVVRENVRKMYTGARLEKMRNVRSAKLANHYSKAVSDARMEFIDLKANPLFTAGLMLYSGEGDKDTKRGHIRISNVDLPILQIFKQFLVKCCGVEMERMRLYVVLYPDLDVAVCSKYWLENLGFRIENMHKPQIIQGKHKTKRLIFGVGGITMCDKFLKTKILEWIRLENEYLLNRLRV